MRRARRRGRSASRAGAGRPGRADTGRSRVEPERGARLACAGSGWKRSDVDAGREDRAPVPDRPARDLVCQRLGHGGDEVHERQRRERDRARAGVREVGAVERHGLRIVPLRRERRPGGQPEVGVDDVEPLVAVASGAGRSPLERTRRGLPGLEREHVDVDPVDPAQRLDLVADEAPERRPGRRRIHVRDDQRAHRWRGERSGPRR